MSDTYICKKCGKEVPKMFLHHCDEPDVAVNTYEEETPVTSHRGETLAEASRLTCGDRNKSYGEPVDNLTNVSILWDAYIMAKYGDREEVNFTPEDVAWMHVLAKMVRTFHSYKHDNYVDAAAYAAIAGECGFVALSK